MKDETIVDLNQDKALSQAMRNLAFEAEPERDLWPEIAAKLPARETKGYNRRWMPVAIAASLVLSLGAVWYSWQNLQQAKAYYVQSQQPSRAQSQVDIHDQIKMMEHEYGLAKSALLAQIGMNAAQSDEDLLTDVKSNLIIIEQATNELKAAIAQQPENPGLLKLLNATYQQELAVLSQLAKLNKES